MKKAVFYLISMTIAVYAHYSTTEYANSNWYYQGPTIRQIPCELCGKAISITEYKSNLLFIDCSTSSSNLPLSDYETSECVSESWSFSIQHDLCEDCRLLVIEKIGKPLREKYKELWSQLVEEKAQEKSKNEKNRHKLHIQETKDKINELQNRLKELEKNLN